MTRCCWLVPCGGEAYWSLSGVGRFDFLQNCTSQEYLLSSLPHPSPPAPPPQMGDLMRSFTLLAYKEKELAQVQSVYSSPPCVYVGVRVPVCLSSCPVDCNRHHNDAVVYDSS